MHLLPVLNLLIRMNLFFCTGSSEFSDGRSPDSEDIEPTCATHRRQNYLSVEKIQDSGFADGRSETSPESESEVDGNEVKSTTGTSVKQIQDSSRSQLTI